MRIGDIAGAMGRGLVAGLVGTAAMTVSSTLEARVRGRQPSTAPADAAAKVLGVEPVEGDGMRFNNAVHWGYGTGWGAVRGAIAGLGASGPVATLVHFAAVWGSEQVVLPSLKVGRPIWRYGATEAAIDGGHHAVYALATGLTYRLLSRD